MRVSDSASMICQAGLPCAFLVVPAWGPRARDWSVNREKEQNMQKTKMSVAELQIGVSALAAKQTSNPEIAPFLRQDYACLYGRAPKLSEERAKATGDSTSRKIDWEGIKRTQGTEDQTLSQVEAGRLRAYCDVAELVLLSVLMAELTDAWTNTIKVLVQYGNAAKEKADAGQAQQA